jgi:hypothetical protein
MVLGDLRGASYRLPGTGDSLHKRDSLHKGDKDSLHKPDELSEEELTKVRVIAVPAFHSVRLSPQETRTIILQLCQGHYFTAADLSELMNRNPEGLRSRFLTPMVEEGLLLRKFPAELSANGRRSTHFRQDAKDGQE